jgi:hypothetical protein
VDNAVLRIVSIQLVVVVECAQSSMELLADVVNASLNNNMTQTVIVACAWQVVLVMRLDVAVARVVEQPLLDFALPLPALTKSGKLEAKVGLQIRLPSIFKIKKHMRDLRKVDFLWIQELTNRLA